MDKQDTVARRGIAELALKGFFDIAQRWKLSPTRCNDLTWPYSNLNLRQLEKW